MVETLAIVLKNFDSEGIDEYDEIVCALTRIGLYIYDLKKLDLDLQN